MRFMPSASAGIALSLILAACSGGGAAPTTVPTPSAPSATQGPQPTQAQATPAATQAATHPAPTQAGAAACVPSTATPTVTAEFKEFLFVPAALTAKVGDVVSWTNADGAPHGVSLDSDNTHCTASLAKGQSGGTTFEAAGTYGLHCFVHPTMKGSITITD